MNDDERERDVLSLSLDEHIKNKKKAKKAAAASPKASLLKKKKTIKSKAKPAKQMLGGKAKPVKILAKTSGKSNGVGGGAKDETRSSRDSSTTAVPQLKITIENKDVKPKAAATKLLGKVSPSELRITTENNLYKPSAALPKKTAPARGSPLLSRLRTRRDDLDHRPIRTTTRYDRDDYDDGYAQDYQEDEMDYYHSSGRGRSSEMRDGSPFSRRAPPRRDLDERESYGILRSRNPHHESNRFKSSGLHETGHNLRLFTGHRLKVYNLHYNISEEDISHIFKRVGEIKSVRINFDRSGRSNGTAYVIYYNKSDADQAVKTFNNAVLDAKSIKVEYDNDNRDF